MKVLSITFLFISLLFTSSVKEKSELICFECLPGSSDYCTGWADAKEQPGWSIYRWNQEYNSCMSNRGCVGGLPEQKGNY